MGRRVVARWAAAVILALVPLWGQMGLGQTVPAQGLPPGPLGLGDITNRAFVTGQLAQESAAGQALAAAAARLAAGTGPLALALRERQDLEALVIGLGARLTQASSGNNAVAERAVQALQDELQQATDRLAALDARIDTEFPEYRALTRPAPLDVAALQALLAPDEALVMTLTANDATFVWAVSPQQAGWHLADLGHDAVAARVTALRRDLGGAAADQRGAAALDDTAARPRGRSFDRGVAHALYRDLFGPVDDIIKDAAHLMVVTDGPLTSLPFALLVTQAPLGADDDPMALRQTDWLIARQAVTTLPAVAGLATLRRPIAARDTAAPAFVGFGDPLLGYRANEAAETPELMAALDTGGAAVVTRGVYEDIARVADLAPLPNTSRELRALARTMARGDTRLYMGRDATEAQVKSADLSRATVLAFATHGLLSGGLPGLDEPALVFTPPAQPSALDDALLTASEAAQLHLAADLIILSACDTAGGDGTPGAEGLSGLARAFIYAGARAILVSHWPVDDYAASRLTVRMLEGMYGPDRQPRAQALRHSMLALMAEPGARFAHPAIWAPFVVVGEGGADRFIP